MARNLIRGGHALTVYARRPAAVEPLVAARTEAVFTMLTATSDVEQVGDAEVMIAGKSLSCRIFIALGRLSVDLPNHDYEPGCRTFRVVQGAPFFQSPPIADAEPSTAWP